MMQTRPTLYKISTHNAAKDSIVVESTQAPNTNAAHVLFCGGFHSSMRGLKCEFLHKLCQEKGWAFTRFDYRGHGESDALFEHCTPHDWLEDTLAVIDQIPNKIVLVGSSMGAWLATHALLQRLDKMQALVTIAAAPDFPQRLLWPALTESEKTALHKGDVISRATPYEDAHWRIAKGLFRSAEQLALLDSTEPLPVSIPVRMLHGTNDQDVPWNFSQQLLERFSNSNEARLTLIQGADHRLSEQPHLELLQEQLTQLMS